MLIWYRATRRDLPWRRTEDPYRIWVSEIMLQQTRVETTIDYYERFLERFPTVEDLALAPEDDVLKLWEGLGYYSRARNLHSAAKTIVAAGGTIPDTYDRLLRLPGVGPYTAAAVASIAFDRPHPVLDGNVIRVLCRMLRVEGDPGRAATRQELLAAGEQLMARTGSGDVNQALMELGARVCTPRSPDCHECPVRSWCRAEAELEDPTTLPIKPPRKERPHLEVTAGVIWKDGKVLLARRPVGGMLAGLWEFPGGKVEAGETLAACLAREIQEELAIDIDVHETLASVDHEYTHLSITLHALQATWRAGEPQAIGVDDWKWVSVEQLDDFAMPRADRRILERLAAEERELAPPQTD
ncbi:MAG: A/G-specific adenine glycosylase [Gemmatimonadetes bacterium]|nr:A/G-specific adenine glycosylase [Gemmatimonadota bacterium]MBT6149337.1 A/G-specific adenine glycosylase [Gemmatimonadota bacterium]MBT7861647.1 A/G-specific adenine glycosylase [Gemmatimonadota bacterium]